MSNLSQFLSKAYPIGSQTTSLYFGDVYTAPDGSVWMMASSTANVTYSAAYSGVPDMLTSPHDFLNGPEPYNLWQFPAQTTGQPMIAFNSAAPLYVTGDYSSLGTTEYYYYTSTNGTTWTRRTFPNSKSYPLMVYTAGQFIGYSPSSTTNAVITSTDGITWSSITGISIAVSNLSEIVSDGSTNILIWPFNTTTAASSTNGGSTWSSATVTNTGFGIRGPGKGGVTWNAGAGLFIGSTSTAGAYQTSPTGATWTLRNTITTFLPYVGYFTSGQTRFASNSTTTVAFGSYGFYATTTDGLTWSNYGFIYSESEGPANITPSEAWYDGTRFCVRYGPYIYYSTNGTSWTKSSPIGTIPSTSVVSGNVLFMAAAVATVPIRMLKIENVTATAPKRISPSASATAWSSSTVNYYRVK